MPSAERDSNHKKTVNRSSCDTRIVQNAENAGRLVGPRRRKIVKLPEVALSQDRCFGMRIRSTSRYKRCQVRSRVELR